MTAEPDTRVVGGLTRTGWSLWTFAALTARRFPDRLREPRFWQVQLLVVVATAPHYIVESSGEVFPTLESWQLNSLAISLYILPLLYAALNYSWEGAVLTALWAAALTSPSMWYWDRSGSHLATEMGQLFVVLPVGLLVAWRVSLETVQRRRAETTSARLAILNEVGEALSQTLEVEQQLPAVLRRLYSGLALQSVWLVLEPESEDGGRTVILEGQPVTPLGLPANITDAAQLRAEAASTTNDSVVVIPLTGEGGPIGALGAMTAPGEALVDGQIELLTTVAHEIRVAVENARLYRERQESLQSYARQVTQAQEDERLRIARELHDETAQELIHLVRGLEALEEGQELPAQIDELVSMARDTIQSVRRFSRDLRPAVLDDLGLLAAIEMVVEDTNNRLAGGASLVVSGEPRRADRTAELALFRIAQEALRNVERHAGAASAAVELNFQGDEITLSVSDDGCGFSPPRNLSQLVRRGSLGLLGMKERAELVGGRFALRSSPGHGSELTVTVEAA